MNRIYFKHHKKFLSFLKLIFSKIFSKILSHFNCLGFYFVVKGKIGVTGNAKKRKFSFSNNQYSLTTKQTKITIQKALVSTHTGVLGVKFLIIFN
jgi:ribosomal protein S3